MKNTQKVKLISGCFTPEESREILMNVFSSKIQFHHMKNFSSKERFGKEDKIAIKRIAQLKKSVEKFSKIITAAEEKNELLELTSVVSIAFVKSKKSV